MRLEEALRKIGVEVVSQESRGEQVVLHLRVRRAEVWNRAMETFLLDPRSMACDVSKHFYASKGTVRYLWRVVMGGNPAEGAAALGRAVLGDSRMPQEELESFPLVGRAHYPLDPATGRTKGAHDPNTAASLVAMMTGGKS